MFRPCLDSESRRVRQDARAGDFSNVWMVMQCH